MPWEAHYKYYKPATGLPPHVILFAYVKSLDLQIKDIPNKIEELLDRRQMAGALSLDQIARAVENRMGPRMTAMAADVAALRASNVDSASADGTNNVGGGHGANSSQSTARLRLHYQFQHRDGKQRRVPPTWQIPKLSLQPMYVYWHCGDDANRIPPMKHPNCRLQHVPHNGKYLLISW
jgi:hypothetical protein